MLVQTEYVWATRSSAWGVQDMVHRQSGPRLGNKAHDRLIHLYSWLPCARPAEATLLNYTYPHHLRIMSIVHTHGRDGDVKALDGRRYCSMNTDAARPDPMLLDAAR